MRSTPRLRGGDVPKLMIKICFNEKTLALWERVRVREMKLGVFRENAVPHENSLASRERVRVSIIGGSLPGIIGLCLPKYDRAGVYHK